MSRSARFLAVIVLALAGCATPRYETVRSLEPPAGEEGRVCARACEASLAACQKDCQVAWQACADRVEPQVEGRFAQALKAYAQDLRRYRRDLDWYEWDMWLGWNHGPGGFWYSPWPYHPWPRAHFWIDPPGDPPTREEVRAGLLKAQCQDDCGCLTRHEACFLGCGGKVVSETRCVANCPAGK